MKNDNQTEGIVHMLNEVLLLVNKFGEDFFGKEKMDEIISGKFNFKSYRKAMADIENVKSHYEMLKICSLEQFKNLASVSALASTLLVIATFNGNIIPFTIWVKVILTVLLVAILISIWAYYKNFSDASTMSYEELLKLQERYGDEESVLVMKEINENTKKKVLNYAPFIVNFLVTTAIFGILILLWLNTGACCKQ